MKKYILLFSVAIITPSITMAQRHDGCTTMPCPPVQEFAPESVRPESGQYVTGPETGEFAGESNSVGIRGFKLRFPEIQLEFPTIQLPSLVRYRRNPEMIVDRSRAPFQENAVMEFGRMTTDPESGLDQPNPENALDEPQCYPYRSPCTSNDSPRTSILEESLQAREAQVRALSQDVAQLQNLMKQLIESQQSSQNVQPTFYQDPTNQSYISPQTINRANSTFSDGISASQYHQKCEEVTELNERLKAMETMCAQLAREQETKLFLERRARLMNQFDQQQSAPQTLPVNNVKHINFVEKAPIPHNEQSEIQEKKTSQLDSSFNDFTSRSFDKNLDW